MKVVVLGEDDPFLDGDPEEFPNRENAMAEYRALWTGFLMGQSVNVGGVLLPPQETMDRLDELQHQICRGPGKLWREFRVTLPGFQEWWASTATPLIKKHRVEPEG